jgi:hypothetical protein
MGGKYSGFNIGTPSGGNALSIYNRSDNNYGQINWVNNAGDAWLGTLNVMADGALTYANYPAGSYTERLRITSGGTASITGNLGLGTSTLGANATDTLALANGTAPAAGVANEFQLYSADIVSGNAAPHFLTEAGDLIKLFKGAALTTALMTLTYTAPGTPDYALQDLVQNTGFGFATKDEGNTALSVIANLQARINDLETRLKAVGLLT